MQKKDRDCGDNAQRDEDEERNPHADRDAVGKRVTTGWHSHASRELFVEFHGFQSPGESPRGSAVYLTGKLPEIVFPAFELSQRSRRTK